MVFIPTINMSPKPPNRLIQLCFTRISSLQNINRPLTTGSGTQSIKVSTVKGLKFLPWFGIHGCSQTSVTSISSSSCTSRLDLLAQRKSEGKPTRRQSETWPSDWCLKCLLSWWSCITDGACGWWMDGSLLILLDYLPGRSGARKSDKQFPTYIFIMSRSSVAVVEVVIWTVVEEAGWIDGGETIQRLGDTTSCFYPQ